MQYSISIYAQGDEEMTLPQIVELADAVAIHKGVASGAGSNGYGVQIIVEGEDEVEARTKALSIFEAAVVTARLPIFEIVEIESISEIEALEELED